MMMLYQFKMGAHEEIFLRFLNFMLNIFVFFKVEITAMSLAFEILDVDLTCMRK